MKKQRCLRCNELPSDHTRSMQIVLSPEAPPKTGGSVNLHTCISKGGPLLPRFSGQIQQGEGRFFMPTKQMG